MTVSSGSGLVAAAAVAMGIAGASSIINKAAVNAAITAAAAAADKKENGAEDPFAKLARELARKKLGPG